MHFINTHRYTHINTYAQTLTFYSHSDAIGKQTHTQIRTHKYAHTHTKRHTNIHTQTNTLTHTYTQPHMYTETHILLTLRPL